MQLYFLLSPSTGSEKAVAARFVVDFLAHFAIEALVGTALWIETGSGTGSAVVPDSVPEIAAPDFAPSLAVEFAPEIYLDSAMGFGASPYNCTSRRPLTAFRSIYKNLP